MSNEKEASDHINYLEGIEKIVRKWLFTLQYLAINVHHKSAKIEEWAEGPKVYPVVDFTVPVKLSDNPSVKEIEDSFEFIIDHFSNVLRDLKRIEGHVKSGAYENCTIRKASKLEIEKQPMPGGVALIANQYTPNPYRKLIILAITVTGFIFSVFTILLIRG